MSLVLSLLLALGTPPVLASIHQYPEGPDRVMYRSLQTLRDRTNRAWQVIVFSRWQAGQVQEIHLRLVGFPGLAEVKHPEALHLTTGTEVTWKAPDLQTEATRSPNVGEYDLLETMTRLNADIPLRLTVPLKTGQIELPVPPFVVGEWRRVALGD